MALFARKKPFQLTGLVASPDGLYDGAFIVAAASWWNHEIATRGELSALGHRALQREEVGRLLEAVQPENLLAFEAMASSVSLPGRHSTAVLSLAYAFALVIEAVSGQIDSTFPDAAFERARRYEVRDLEELDLHYSQKGWVQEVDRWSPYWSLAETLIAEKASAKVITSLRASFDDQVDRWSAAEGVNLRNTIGAPDFSLVTADENAGFVSFVELLFEWGGRLRLGERLLAEGYDLRDLRYVPDEVEFTDMLYAEAYARYIEIASQDAPLSGEIEVALRHAARWLAGEDADDALRLAVSTTAARAYLWRSVEDGATSHLEPELTQAVERSFELQHEEGADGSAGAKLFYAASQCVVDEVQVRMGSIGGFLGGPRNYERALFDTTSDYDEHAIEIEEPLKRQAFLFGVCLADSERVLRRVSTP